MKTVKIYLIAIQNLFKLKENSKDDNAIYLKESGMICYCHKTIKINAMKQQICRKILGNNRISKSTGKYFL